MKTRVRVRGLQAPPTTREERMINFNTLLIQVNQLLMTIKEDIGFCQSVCDLIVAYGRFTVAFIAVPDEYGFFQYVAASGELGYIQNLVISTDPALPEGRGSLGIAWRENCAKYNQMIHDALHMTPWKDRASRFGIRSSASLPIHRNGRPWGMLSIYHSDEQVFNVAMKSLVETLALDITNGLERLDLQRAERRSDEIYRHFVERGHVGMLLVQNDGIVMANTYLIKLLGYTKSSELIGQSILTLFPSLSDVDEETVTTMITKTGDQLFVTIARSELEEQEGSALTLCTIQNITATYQLQQQLAHAAWHDVLTGLPNRRWLDIRLSDAIDQAAKTHHSVWVGMFDIDRFKWVNDTYGHAAGDGLLIELAKRLFSKMGEDAILARWGGDEFVAVWSQGHDMPNRDRLFRTLDKLHTVVESPFEVIPGEFMTIDMSMGIAEYPWHGDNSYLLLREADAALYQAKRRARPRTSWWQWGRVDTSVSSSHPNFAFPIEAMVVQLEESLVNHPVQQAVNAALSPLEKAQLKQRQIDHLKWLLYEAEGNENIRDQANQFGEVQALMGLSGDIVMQATATYMRLVNQTILQHDLPSPMPWLFEYSFRVQLDSQAQLRTMEQTMMKYLQVLTQQELPQGCSYELLHCIGQLPGMLGVLWIELDLQKGFLVKIAVGAQAKDISDETVKVDSQIMARETRTKGESLLAQAWNQGSIQISATYQQDGRFEVWHEAARRMGVRSMMMIPVLDDARRTVAMIGMYGAYSNQFASSWMQVFARGVQQWGQERFYFDYRERQKINMETASAYRKRLFQGGLVMMMQPIVELRTGSVLKYEALARLQDVDGTLYAPDVFLPLLGRMETARLFQLGFEQGLCALTQWGESEGQAMVAVNIAPTTVNEPGMGDWIETTLRNHNVPPSRITLELLETGSDNLEEVKIPLHFLSSLGIQLAMDDLGAGDSNLVRLATLPFNMVKLDRGLWRALKEQPVSTLMMLEGLIRAGNEFGWGVVVEGLETLDMTEAALALGARYGQGYFLARPMPIDHVVAWHASFRNRIDSTHLQTELGTLAYLVRSLSVREDLHELEKDCPVTQFMIEHGWQDSEAMTWHRQLHEGVFDFTLAQKLVRWMEQQYQQKISHNNQPITTSK